MEIKVSAGPEEVADELRKATGRSLLARQYKAIAELICDSVGTGHLDCIRGWSFSWDTSLNDRETVITVTR